VKNACFFMRKSNVFFKKATAHAGQPVFRDRLSGSGMFSEKFCFEVCGMTHLRINKKTSGRHPCRPQFL